MSRQNMLELLDMYRDIIAKQDELISRLCEIVAKQATDLQLLENDMEFSDEKLERDKIMIDQLIDHCNNIKKGLEP